MRNVLTCLLLACLLFTSAQAAPAFPELTDRVVDNSHLLSMRERVRIDTMLAAHEGRTTNQVVVLTTPSLDGMTIEDYGVQLARYWKLGETAKNNGVLLLIATQNHEARIEVGYGLEGQLTDADTSRIINDEVLPQFRAGQMERGVLQGVKGILHQLGDDESAKMRQGQGVPVSVASPPSGTLSPQTMLLIVLALGVYILLCLRHPEIAWFTFRMILILSSGSRSTGGQSFSGEGGSFGGGGASGKW